MDGYVSQNVEVRHPNNSVSPTLTICPSYDDSYKDVALKVQYLSLYFRSWKHVHDIPIFQSFNVTKNNYKKQGYFLGSPTLKTSANAKKIYNAVSRANILLQMYVVLHLCTFRWLGI